MYKTSEKHKSEGRSYFLRVDCQSVAMLRGSRYYPSGVCYPPAFPGAVPVTAVWCLYLPLDFHATVTYKWSMIIPCAAFLLEKGIQEGWERCPREATAAPPAASATCCGISLGKAKMIEKPPAGKELPLCFDLQVQAEAGDPGRLPSLWYPRGAHLTP